VVDGEGKAGLAVSLEECGSKSFKSEPTEVSAGVSSQIPLCPDCLSKTKKVFRAGLRYKKDGSSVQRWLCTRCGLRFSEKPLQKSSKRSLNTSSLFPSARQICALGAKNLTSATQIKTVAGDLEKLPQDARVLLTKYMACLEREGYYGDTVYLKQLKTLVKDGADLRNPEDVKTKIARHTFKNKDGEIKQWSNGSKNLAVFAYDAFCKMEGIAWQRPSYRQDEAIIRAPVEEDIDALIASTTSKRMATFLRCLKETYADPGEVLAIEWRDIKRKCLNHRSSC
jgi:transposase-like protein